MKTEQTNNAIQLSLFDDMRELSDESLIKEITRKEEVTDIVSDFEFSYRMEVLFNRMTPHHRRIAAAAIELYKRKEIHARRVPKISCSKDVYNLMKYTLKDLPTEEFWIIGANLSGKVVVKQRISMGSIDCTLGDTRVIMRTLIEHSASMFFAVHNHPSGRVTPSMPDRKLTEELRKAGEILKIKLQDHLIIAGDTYLSFSDEGFL